MKKSGYAKLHWVIADKLKPSYLKIYYLIKSHQGFKRPFDLSQNQMVKATGMSKGTINKCLKKMEEWGLIIRKKRNGYYQSDIIILKEAEFIKKADPKNTYNSERAKIWRLSSVEKVNQ